MLNERQKEAVEFEEGAAIVLAGPGTGKTTIITQRVKRLLERGLACGKEILVVTFTKAAATEMQQRFVKMAGDISGAEGVLFGTFHSVFYQMLKESNPVFRENSILTENNKNRLLREIIMRLKIECTDINEFLKEISGEISRFKGTDISRDNFKSNVCKEEEFFRLYDEYEKSLRHERQLDFDDLIIKCHEMLLYDEEAQKYWQNRFRFILIDEFQDISKMQYENIKLLTQKRQNLFVVGDDDQSIYGFRGADGQLMFSFVREFHNVKKISLNTNYRSTEKILESAKNLISHNVKRYDKSLKAHLGAGENVEIRYFKNNIDEYRFMAGKIKEYEKKGIDLREIAILIRNNASMEVVQSFLENENIISGRKRKSNIYRHFIAKDMAAYISSAVDGEKTQIARIINKPYRYISTQFLKKEISIDELKNIYHASPEILDNINNFVFHLQMIKKLKPYAAVNYIRYGCGYDEYLREYACKHNLKYKQLVAACDEIQNKANGYGSLGEWLENYKKMQENSDVGAQETEKGCANKDAQGVSVITMHASKGLEFKVVFVPDVNQGVIPEMRSLREGTVDEERRLFYVALTRAAEHLHVLSVEYTMGRKCQKSQFINEMCSCLHF